MHISKHRISSQRKTSRCVACAADTRKSSTMEDAREVLSVNREVWSREFLKDVSRRTITLTTSSVSAQMANRICFKHPDLNKTERVGLINHLKCGL